MELKAVWERRQAASQGLIGRCTTTAQTFLTSPAVAYTREQSWGGRRSHQIDHQLSVKVEEHNFAVVAQKEIIFPEIKTEIK